MDALPVNNKTAGEAESTYNKTLETGAGATQVSFAVSPKKKIVIWVQHFMTDYFRIEFCACKARLRPS